MKKKAKIAVCSAFQNGHEVISFIAEQPHKIEFVATCKKDDSEYEEEIAKICKEKGIKVFRKTDANDKKFIEQLRDSSIDIVIMAWWPDIIKSDAIRAVNIGWLNMHPSLLPHGRGKHAYYWSVVEGSPFGVSLHFIDEGVDTGRVLFQRPIEIDITDTGESLYRKGSCEVVALFKRSYEKIINLDFKAVGQDNSKATSHMAQDIEAHSTIDLSKKYKASDLINILRGRTFFSGESAYFFLNGKKYYARVSIEKAKE